MLVLPATCTHVAVAQRISSTAVAFPAVFIRSKYLTLFLQHLEPLLYVNIVRLTFASHAAIMYQSHGRHTARSHDTPEMPADYSSRGGGQGPTSVP